MSKFTKESYTNEEIHNPLNVGIMNDWSAVTNSVRTILKFQVRQGLRYVNDRAHIQPWLLSTLVLVASTLVLISIHALLGFSTAADFLYVAPVWLATRLDGKRSGLAAILFITVLLTVIDAQGRPYASTSPLVQGLSRFCSLGIVMLVIAHVEGSMASVKRLAFRDPLTGLLNRRGLREFANSLNTAEQEPGVVVVMDCDDFKEINDQHGHEAGDRVLGILGRILEAHTRSSDLVVRMGGDEFALILNNGTREEIAIVLHRIEREFELQTAEAGYPCTLSAGVVWMQNPADLEQSLQAADQAMYAAKKLKRETPYLI